MSTQTTQNEDAKRAAVDSSSGLDGLLPCGSQVRHKRTGLTGRIRNYEYASKGVVSALPYNVQWDDDSRAAKELGWLFIYPSPEAIEAV